MPRLQARVRAKRHPMLLLPRHANHRGSAQLHDGLPEVRQAVARCLLDGRVPKRGRHVVTDARIALDRKLANEVQP